MYVKCDAKRPRELIIKDILVERKQQKLSDQQTADVCQRTSTSVAVYSTAPIIL